MRTKCTQYLTHLIQNVPSFVDTFTFLNTYLCTSDHQFTNLTQSCLENIIMVESNVVALSQTLNFILYLNIENSGEFFLKCLLNFFSKRAHLLPQFFNVSKHESLPLNNTLHFKIILYLLFGIFDKDSLDIFDFLPSENLPRQVLNYLKHLVNTSRNDSLGPTTHLICFMLPDTSHKSSSRDTNWLANYIQIIGSNSSLSHNFMVQIDFIRSILSLSSYLCFSASFIPKDILDLQNKFLKCSCGLVASISGQELEEKLSTHIKLFRKCEVEPFVYDIISSISSIRLLASMILDGCTAIVFVHACKVLESDRFLPVDISSYLSKTIQTQEYSKISKLIKVYLEACAELTIAWDIQSCKLVSILSSFTEDDALQKMEITPPLPPICEQVMVDLSSDNNNNNNPNSMLISTPLQLLPQEIVDIFEESYLLALINSVNMKDVTLFLKNVDYFIQKLLFTENENNLFYLFLNALCGLRPQHFAKSLGVVDIIVYACAQLQGDLMSNMLKLVVYPNLLPSLNINAKVDLLKLIFSNEPNESLQQLKDLFLLDVQSSPYVYLCIARYTYIYSVYGGNINLENEIISQIFEYINISGKVLNKNEVKEFIKILNKFRKIFGVITSRNLRISKKWAEMYVKVLNSSDGFKSFNIDPHKDGYNISLIQYFMFCAYEAHSYVSQHIRIINKIIFSFLFFSFLLCSYFIMIIIINVF